MLALLLSVITWLMPSHLSAALPQQPAQQPAQPPAIHPAPTELLPSATLEQNLTGAEAHTYTVALDPGDFLHLVVEEKNITVGVKVFAPDGSLTLEQNNPGGSEDVFLVASTGGTYRLVVGSVKGQTRGRYVLRVLARRPASDDDRKQAESIQKATALLVQAAKLAYEGTATESGPKYDEALLAAQEALALQETVYGPEHPRVAETLDFIADLHRRTGNLPQATAVSRQVLAMREKTLAPEHPQIAETLKSLGLLFEQQGYPAEAEDCYRRATAMVTATKEPDSLDLAYSLWGMGRVQAQQGNLSSAVNNLQQALDILEKTPGTRPTTIGDLLWQLSELLHYRGEDNRAEPLSRRALVFYESAQDARYLLALEPLTAILCSQHRYGEAEALYRQALVVLEKAHKRGNSTIPLNESFLYAKNLMHLGRLRRLQKDYAAADQLLRESLHALTRESEALSRNYPVPYAEDTLDELSILALEQGRPREALTFQIQANTAREYWYPYSICGEIWKPHGARSQGSDSYGFNRAEGATRRTLTLHLQHLPQDQDAARAALTALLQHKGRALDAVVNSISILRQQGTPEDTRYLDELTALTNQITALTQRGPAPNQSSDAHCAELSELQERIRALQANLVAHHSRKRFTPVTLEAVQNAIPPDAALLEYAVYAPVDPTTEQPRPPRYAVYVLKTDGTLHWADLGEAAPIDTAIQQFRRALSTPARQATAVRRAGARLAAQVIAPIAPALTGIRRLLLSPDGQLNLIPFEALPGRRSQYLLEQFAITYLTSGRDLLALQHEDSPQPRTP